MTTPSQDPGPRRPPEQLTHLSIAGFRSIRRLDLPLRGLNVLIGANGSGKTNLVAFFTMLREILADGLQLYIQTRGGASSILHYGPKFTPQLDARLTFTDDESTSNYGLSLSFAAPDRLIFFREELEFHRAGEPKQWQRSIKSGVTETSLTKYAEAQHDSPALRKIAQVFLRRLEGLRVYHFHDTSDTAAIRLTQDLSDNRRLDRYGGNLAAFLYMLRRRFPAHYERILATVRLAVPYLRDLVLEPEMLNPAKIQLRWRDRSAGHEFGPHQLSDGSVRAIALVTALLQPEETLPGLIAIDEPELGLHPSAITTIAHLLQAAAMKRQVIVATQSSRLISALQPEDVVVVEREEDEGGRGFSTFQRLSEEALGAWRERYDLGQLFEMNVTGGGPR